MKKTLIYNLLILISVSAYGQGEIKLSGEDTQGGEKVACNKITLVNTFSFKAEQGKSLILRADPATCNPYGTDGNSTDNTSPSSDQNYIRTRSYTNADGSRYLDQIQYFDGLGRLSQTVQRGITPQIKDLVALQEYDSFGREGKAWLPYPESGNSGAYVQSFGAESYYQDKGGNAYNEPVYESSPLNRVLEQYGPGTEWRQSGGKSVKTNYLTNNDAYPCLMFEVLNDVLVAKGKYDNGQLFVTEIKDEGGNTSYEFKNKLGQVVLTRQMNDTDKHDTYYIYDDFGNLRFVLPPMMEGRTDTELLNKYGYIYKYDYRNRCIEKKLPGCDPIHYVYDKADRLIFSQDGEQRLKNEWTYSIPDALGRVVQTGLCYNTDITLDNYKNKIVIGKHITDRSYEFENFEPIRNKILTINYYDTYDFLSGYNNDIKAVLEYKDRDSFGHRYNSAKGLLTGTYINTIPSGLEGALDSYGALYYDERGLAIQTKKTLYQGEGFDKEYISYNFSGQPIKKLHEHIMSGFDLLKELYLYDYDHAGRLNETRHRLNDGNDIVIAKNTYDETGRLSSTQINNNAALKTDYSYNIRSWITQMNNPNYRESLEYDFVGNITQIKDYNVGRSANKNWEVSIEYDNLSRMTSYMDMGVGSPNETFIYDKNGNIKSLNRSGPVADDYDSIDDLTFTYDGNQIQTIIDLVTDGDNAANSYDFKNLTGSSSSYLYNRNGAMTKDPYKGTTISYNLLNLPQEISVNNPLTTGNIYYIYYANGEKMMSSSSSSLRRSLNSSEIAGGVSSISSSDRSEVLFYIGNVIYKMIDDGDLYVDKILIENGYIKDGIYYFYLKDHLENNRVVTNLNGGREQTNDYFPFGMSVQSSNKPQEGFQPYKFGGKELETLMGLNLYDFHARQYEPTLARFHTVDPLAEKYYNWSPYVYCANNPMKFIDPDGRDWYLNQKTGELYYNKNTTDATTKYNDTEYTRIGGNDMMGSMKDISEKAYGFDESAELAQNNNYAINPVQQIQSEISREQPYSTGPNDVTITTGEIEIINEKYSIFSATADKQVNTSTKILYNKEYSLSDFIDTILTAGKKTNIIQRNTYTYKKSGTGDKVGRVLGTVYDVLETVTTGKHDYRNTTVYNNWKSYGNGRMFKYK